MTNSEGSAKPMSARNALIKLGLGCTWLAEHVYTNRGCTCNDCYLCAYRVLEQLIARYEEGD